MKKPIKEMQYTPYGEDYMFPAWYSCVISAIANQDVLNKFRADTGLIMTDILNPPNVLARMIDEATGYDKEVIVKWCDWVTKNLWGTEDDND